MKVTINKRNFTLDEIDDIKQFKAEWQTPTIDEIKTAVQTTAYGMDIPFCNLIAVQKIEISKSHFKPTYWITTVIKGTNKYNKNIFAEMEFDYVQAILASPGDKIDNYTIFYIEDNYPIKLSL
ncbi:MAG: hypothetical protein ACI4MQ_04015 [Candidatus Coproplasma sp.]